MQSLAYYLLLARILTSAKGDNYSSEIVSLVPAQLQTVVDYGVYINNEQEHSNAEVLPDSGSPIRVAQLLDDGTLQLTNDLLTDGHIVEGDIMITEKDLIASYPKPPEDITGKERVKRKVSGRSWPNAIVPWEISSTAPPYRQATLDKIKEAMKWWQLHTCVRFVPAASKPSLGHDKVLSIKNYLKCSSYVGFQDRLSSNKQAINLFEALCFTSIGTAAHELGHALGLIHEHSRVDRDQYVAIHPNAVDPNSLHNYAKSHQSTIPDGVHYDLSSIMHYTPSTFAVQHSKPAMTGKNLRKQSLMGQRDALSYYDIKAINLHYQCQGSCSSDCENEGYAYNKDGRCTCICPEGLSGSRCQKIDSDCGGILTLRADQMTTLHSKTYTQRSQASRCIWLIKAPTGYNIEINFDEFDIAKTRTSIYGGYECVNTVEVRNNLLGQRGDIYCGQGAVGPIDTEMGEYTDRMLVVLNMANGSLTRTNNFRATISSYVDACLSSPCLNDGRCTSQRASTFTCACPEGFTGPVCDVITTSGVSCDFSKDFCGFSQDLDDDIDFHREFQSFKYSEEIKTHSFNNKFFIGAPVEFALPRLGAKARLRSQTFSSSLPTRCLTFSYFMNGDWQEGVLAVALVFPGDYHPIRNISTVTKQQQSRVKLLDGWRKETVDILHDADYQVLFTFTAGTSSLYTSMMALDDISILPQKCHLGPCSLNPCKEGAMCSETSDTSYQCLCSPGTTGTNCGSYDINGFTCTFDSENLCGWTQDQSDNFDWIRTYGASDILERTGPVKSAQGEGYYVVADTSASTSSTGSHARLISPVIEYSGSICVSFYYHMHGHKVGTLNLILQSHGSQPIQYFSKSGEQSTEWHYTSVDVLLPDIRSRLLFEAVVGQKHLSDIAVDDVTINKGRCGTSIIRLPQIANLIHPHNAHLSSTTTTQTTKTSTTTPQAASHTTTQPTTQQRVTKSRSSHTQLNHLLTTTQRSVLAASNEREATPHQIFLHKSPLLHRTGLPARGGQFIYQRSSWPSTTGPRIHRSQATHFHPSAVRQNSSSSSGLSVRQANSTSTIAPSMRRPHSTSTIAPSVGRSHSTSPTAPSVGRSNSTSPTAPSGGRSHSTSPTAPSVGRSHSTSPTAPSGGRSHSTSPTAPSVGQSHSTSPTAPSVGRSHSTSPTAPSVGRSHSTSPTAPSGGRSHSTSPTAPSVGRSHSTSPTAPSVGRSRSTSPTTPSVGRSHSTSPTAPSVGRSHSTSPTAPRVGHPQTSVAIQNTRNTQARSAVQRLLQQATPRHRVQRRRLRSRHSPSRSPRVRRSKKKLIDCDFEQNSCQKFLYFPVPTQVWKRIRGPTQSVGTGPEAAAGGEYYIHMDASIGQSSDRNNNVFRISTFPLQYSGEMCIKMDYHMKGPTVDRLSVYMLPVEDTERLLWQRRGDQGDDWHKAVITSTVKANSTVVIEAIRGRSYQADIAIDNLTILKGACNQTHSTRSRSKARGNRRRGNKVAPTNSPVKILPPVQQKMTQSASIEYRCDFEENSFCDFVNEKGDDSDWIIHSGSTPSAGTGPESAQSGEDYIYVEASGPTRPGSVARLVSPRVANNAGQLCLEVYAHMYGQDMGQLTIYQRFSNGQTNQLVYRNRGDSNVWNLIRATIPSAFRSYVVVFEVITSTGNQRWLSDIALDNLSLTSGAC